MEATLIIDSGRQRGRAIALAIGTYLIGRSPACQIRPQNKAVSRRHCALIYRTHSLSVQDLGSRTGTYVNGERIEVDRQTILRDGDRLQVGQSHFILSIASRTTSTPEREKSTSCAASPTRHIRVARYSGGGRSDSSVGYSATAILDRPEASPRASSCHVASSVSADRLLLREGNSQPSSQQQQFPSATKPKRADAAVGARDSMIDSTSAIDVESVDATMPPKGVREECGPRRETYQLRHDWDVQAVRQWIATKKPVEKPMPPARFRLKGDTQNKKPKMTPEAYTLVTGLLETLDGDMLRPTAIVAAVILFVAWIAYHAWLLIAFSG